MKLTFSLNYLDVEGSSKTKRIVREFETSRPLPGPDKFIEADLLSSTANLENPIPTSEFYWDAIKRFSQKFGISEELLRLGKIESDVYGTHFKFVAYDKNRNITSQWIDTNGIIGSKE